MAIERFEVGKKYRWVGPNERQDNWDYDGKMDFLLDGKPHRVTKARGMLASFEKHPNPYIKDKMWGLDEYENYFEEVVE